MDVRRQGLGYPLLLHQHKGYAIREAPILVGAGPIQIQRILKKRLGDGAKTVSFLLQEFREELQSSDSTTDPRVPVRDLEQDTPVEQKHGVLLQQFAVERFGPFMMGIVFVFQGNGEA